MKKILIFVSLFLVVIAGYPQRTVASSRQASTRPSVSVPARVPAPQSQCPSSAVRTKSPAAPVYRQADRQPVPANSGQPAQNYNRRPVTASERTQSRSPMPDNYNIPSKPSVERPGQASEKRGYVYANRPDSYRTTDWQLHGPSYGNVHPVPHGYHPRPPMHHPIHHRPIPMHHCIYDHWRFSGMLWHNYWYHMHTYSYLPHSVVIVNFNRMGYPNKLIDYVVTDSLIFSLYVDNFSGKRYFAITDDNDNTLARVEVARRYEKIMVDQYGVWLLPRNGDNPMYFMFIEGELYIYDCD